MTFIDEKLPPVVVLTHKLSRINWLLIALIATLCIVGVLALYSVAGGSFEPWAFPQIMRILVGFVILFIVALIPLRIWFSVVVPFYVAAVGLLVLNVFIGISAKGAQRWIDFGLINFQPSEVAKIALIMALATYYSLLPKTKVSHPIWVALPAALVLLPSLLVASQPDLGTGILIMLAGGVVMFLAGVHYLYFAAVILAVIGVVATVLLSQGTTWQILQDYQYNRINTFFDPSSDPFGAGYHIIQSKIAIGSGGLHGRGFLQGTQSQLDFLPEKHTDFVFTTLAEEFGLIWCMILLTLFVIIVLICSIAALRCKDRFGSLLVLGISSLVFLTVTTNVAMITGLIPVVGIPLPLISYGGSSMMALMIGFGLVQNVIIHAERY